MFKLDLEKAEKPEIKLPTYAGPSKTTKKLNPRLLAERQQEKGSIVGVPQLLRRGARAEKTPAVRSACTD